MGCDRKNMFKTISHECDLQVLEVSLLNQGLKDAVATRDPITVFGPTNKPLYKWLSDNQGENVQSALLYHVVPQYLRTKDITTRLYPTLSGQSVRANKYSSPTFNNVTTINGVPLCYKDIKASNGVLHKIDQVLVPPTLNIPEIALSNPDFSTLVAAVVKAELVEALAGPDLTVFAPTNKAFDDLAKELGFASGIELVGDLSAQELNAILLYHVLGSVVFSAAIKEGKTKDIQTLLEGQTIDLKRRCDKILIKDGRDRHAAVIGADVLATNGVVHAIDRVLLPSE